MFKMFTGLVETIGTVSSITKAPEKGTILEITDCESILTDVVLGDSISVNGTCLTVTSFSPQHSGGIHPTHFTVSVAPETLRRTNLGSLIDSSRVNLERAVSASTRMGGHFVQGHVDTVARIASVTPDGEALTFRLVPRDQGILRYVVEKGYVTLDGASLTATKVSDPVVSGTGEKGYWEIMLIPYTQEKIVTASKKVGEEVNVEIDVVGKYVERAVEGYFSGMSDGAEGAAVKGGPAILEKMVGRIVDEKLKAAGGGNR